MCKNKAKQIFERPNKYEKNNNYTNNLMEMYGQSLLGSCFFFALIFSKKSFLGSVQMRVSSSIKWSEDENIVRFDQLVQTKSELHHEILIDCILNAFDFEYNNKWNLSIKTRNQLHTFQSCG